MQQNLTIGAPRIRLDARPTRHNVVVVAVATITKVSKETTTTNRAATMASVEVAATVGVEVEEAAVVAVFGEAVADSNTTEIIKTAAEVVLDLSLTMSGKDCHALNAHASSSNAIKCGQ